MCLSSKRHKHVHLLHCDRKYIRSLNTFECAKKQFYNISEKIENILTKYEEDIFMI